MAKGVVSDSVIEEFYQVSSEILTSFNLNKPPLDLYYFNEEISKLRPFVRAKQKLSKEKQEEIIELCKEGKIFISRSDKPIYIKYIGRQLDLILQDKNLKESEAADAIDFAMKEKIGNFYEQPIKHLLELLVEDIKVFVEYLIDDPLRIKSCVRRISKEDSLVAQSVNCLYVGVGIYLDMHSKEVNKRFLEGLSLGLSLLNLGLSKLPPYIRKKKDNLNREERSKFILYPSVGANIIQKHGIRNRIAVECIIQHQERLDGSGFPQKLKERDIGIAGKISAVSYAFSELLPHLKEINGSTLREIVRKLADQKRKFSQRVCSCLMNVIYNFFG